MTYMLFFPIRMSEIIIKINKNDLSQTSCLRWFSFSTYLSPSLQLGHVQATRRTLGFGGDSAFDDKSILIV